MIGAVIALAVGSLDGIDVDRLLSAIAEVEGHQWSDPGGKYAFTERTWRQHTKRDYQYACSPPLGEQVARAHLAWLAAQLKAYSYPVTAYTLAACWNLGFQGHCRRVAVLDYAVRVTNIYEAEK